MYEGGGSKKRNGLVRRFILALFLPADPQFYGQSLILKANPWIGQPILLHPENVDWPNIWIGQPINGLALFLLPTSEP